MSTRDKIKEWFAKPDFEEGLTLLKELTNNKVLLGNLQRRKQTQWAKDKLNYELGKHYQKHSNYAKIQKKAPKVVKKEPLPNTTQKVIDTKTELYASPQIEKIEFSSLPPELKSVYIKTIELTQSRDKNCLMLHSLESAEDRRLIQEQILGQQETIMNNYKQLDHWVATSKVRDFNSAITNLKDFTQMNAVELLKERNNARSNRTKWKKKMDDFSRKSKHCKTTKEFNKWDEKRHNAQVKYLEFDQDIKEIEKLMQND